ncbi:MAG: formylglycine-generating enzyme family protein [Bacteroidia bacterium]
MAASLYKDARFIRVKGGTFTMGCTAKQGCEPNEQPAHEVWLPDFYLGKYEVTTAEFAEFAAEMQYKTDAEEQGMSYVMSNGLYPFKGINWRNDVEGWHPQPDNCPVMRVSWNDAQAYCKWFSQKMGKKCRLPTEAEWEYAAKGGNPQKGFLYAGSDTLSSVGWYHDNLSAAWYHDKLVKKNLTEGGKKQANALGLYDMSGNVAEWCQDGYEATFYKQSIKKSPVNEQETSVRIVRGGSWFTSAPHCTATFRTWEPPNTARPDIGFRIVIEP